MKLKPFVVTMALAMAPVLSHAEVVDDLLQKYRQQGAGSFNAKAGETLWSRGFTDARTGQVRDCGTCHTQDLRDVGKHASTGKRIEPMAPSVNRQRLTDAGKIEKWFARNCKWTFGRECTAQEKGDFLTFIRSR